MAREYGGKYSPGAGQTLAEAKRDHRVRDAAGARSNVMFVPGVVMLLSNLTDGPTSLVLGGIGAGALTLGAYLLREGLRAEAAFNLRKIAKRPAIPRKLFSTVLTGAGVTLGALAGGADLAASLIYGVTAGVLHVLAFGTDPFRDKLVEGIDTFQQDRVAKVVDEAEDYLAEIRAQIDSLNERGLNARVGDFIDSARIMIDRVEGDPRDLTAARKYLGVYLMGARDATVKFADLWRRTGNVEARLDYESLLKDLEGNFAARSNQLLLEDRTDMDIEIKVLRDRLQREGVYAERKGQE